MGDSGGGRKKGGGGCGGRGTGLGRGRGGFLPWHTRHALLPRRQHINNGGQARNIPVGERPRVVAAEGKGRHGSALVDLGEGILLVEIPTGDGAGDICRLSVTPLGGSQLHFYILAALICGALTQSAASRLPDGAW